ncbi:MAG: AAA family ATPase [Clostridiales bacterium]|jgi:RecA/RadA recombinase|nr:AAA family ATPase [Clostridiales bacterium]
MVNNIKICTFDEIEAEEIQWLWKPYIAFGKLTVIQGDPGNGKTTLALAIAALVSQNRRMPTGGAKSVSGNVIYQSSEDSPKDTIKPRLVACKADCSKIAFMETDCGLDIKIFEEVIVSMNAKFIVIDPLQAFLSANQDISSTKNMRPLLRELSNMAERTGAAIVIIGHMNKKYGAKSIYRGLGSIDITAAARSVLLIGKRKSNENIRFMAQIKNNLTAFGKTISFTINNRGGVDFLGECDISEDELLSADEKKTKFQIAEEMITAMLSSGDKKSNEIFDACIKAGVSASTMHHVKKQLGIKSVRKIDDCYWTLNPDIESSDYNDYIQTEPTDEIDETPVLFLDDISSLQQLSTLPEHSSSQYENSSDGIENNLPINEMLSPFGELELLDWGAFVI